MATETKRATAAALVPAVVYIRMSSDKQENSPEQQRAELRKLAAAHGYKITREYFDSARSGTSAKSRPEFLRMMHDVQDDPQFRFILVWDQDRFGRFDPVEANHYWFLLREAGVQIHSVAQGIIRTDELGEWLKASIAQHGKRQYVIDLSRNVLRGTLKLAREGRPTGKIPFGFMQVATNGDQTIYLKRNCRTRKPKGWTSRLELSDDVREVETVRWMFESYGNSVTSLRSMAADLNRRAVPSPEETLWNVTSIRQILTNPAYIGRASYGLRRLGKLHQVTDDGEIGAVTSRKPRTTAPIQVENAHPEIVSAALFERVQERLEQRAIRRTKPRVNGALLSGLVFCGHCGQKMFGGAHFQKKRGRSYRYYVCSGATTKGTCSHQTISADVLDNFVIDLLKRNMLSPEAVLRLRKQIERQLAERGKRQPDRAKALQGQVAELDRKIKRGTANLLEADSRHVRDMSDMLNDLRTQRAAVQAELDGLSVSKTSRVSVDAAIANLERLADILKSPNKPKVRELLHSLIERIDLWFRREGRRSRLAKGNCILIGPGQVSGYAIVGSPTITQPETFTLRDLPGLWLAAEEAAHAVEVLDRGEGVTMAEAAEHLGLSRDTCEHKLRDARRSGLVELCGKRGGKFVFRATGRLFGEGRVIRKKKRI